MSWRDLTPIPGDEWELARPEVSESSPPEGPPHPMQSNTGGSITLDFTDAPSREWFAEWCRSKRGRLEASTGRSDRAMDSSAAVRLSTVSRELAR
jgi:hypothetical protein